MIRTIIIDDESAAVSVLSLILQRKCSSIVEIVGTSGSAAEGKKLIETLSPDLVFLDIEMPGMTGIELLQSIPDPSFEVVFVTAYDFYALQAFRLSALDYLLKPVESEDVADAVRKVESSVKSGGHSLASRLKSLEQHFQNSLRNESQVGIGMSDRIVFVETSDIIYCEASGNYTHIFLENGEKLVSSKTLGEFEAQLSSQRFLRIHHSHLINLRKVREFQKQDGGYVIMKNKKQLDVSQRKRREFLDAINDILV